MINIPAAFFCLLVLCGVFLLALGVRLLRRLRGTPVTPSADRLRQNWSRLAGLDRRIAALEAALIERARAAKK